MTFEIITSKENWTRSIQAMDHYDFYHTFDYHELSKKIHPDKNKSKKAKEAF